MKQYEWPVERESKSWMTKKVIV